MAYSFFRFLRSVRSVCLPFTSVLLLSLFLTWFFILYHPTLGPGEVQRIGWQSWDLASVGNNEQVSAGNSEPADDDVKTPLEQPEDGVDWWNVTAETEQKVDPTSFPLDVWSPLLPHDTGLTEVTVLSCFLPSYLSYLCVPKSTSEADTLKGKWVQVPVDLNRQAGYYSLFLYYRRSRRLDVNLITNMQLLPDKETPSTDGNWYRVDKSIRDGVPRASPLYLWYELGPPAYQLTDADKSNLITEIDVLRGEDVPWYGFNKMEPATTQGRIGRYESVYVTYRRGVKVAPRAPPLHFSHDGKFKILQVADLHFSVSSGVCRDLPQPCTNSDNLTNTLIAHVLDEEMPSMVVFSGDQLNGQGTSWDSKAVLAKFSKEVARRGIPWAAIFGNHDSEDGLSRKDQIKLLQALPYSLVQPGPTDVHGEGNYVHRVFSADPSKMHLLTLYFLDSGSYSAGVKDFFGFIHPTEYDWIHQDQIDWFLEESSHISPIERPFTPDGGKDIGGIWNKRQGVSQVTPVGRKLAKPNALMFFHIPLVESYNAPDIDSQTDLPLDVGMHDLEAAGNAKKNDGFFEKGILNAMESNSRSSSNPAREVKVIANGHCHLTENCRRVQGVWFCFGGGGSYSGYGKIGFDRRFRVYDISDYGETIKTYKRTDKDEIVDQMVLVGKGAPSPYEGL